MADVNRRFGPSVTWLQRFGADVARKAFVAEGQLFDEDECPTVEPELPESAIERLDQAIEIDLANGRWASVAELELACEAYEKEVWRILESGEVPS